MSIHWAINLILVFLLPAIVWCFWLKKLMWSFTKWILTNIFCDSSLSFGPLWIDWPGMKKMVWPEGSSFWSLFSYCMQFSWKELGHFHDPVKIHSGFVRAGKFYSISTKSRYTVVWDGISKLVGSHRPRASRVNTVPSVASQYYNDKRKINIYFKNVLFRS